MWSVMPRIAEVGVEPTNSRLTNLASNRATQLCNMWAWAGVDTKRYTHALREIRKENGGRKLNAPLVAEAGFEPAASRV